MNHHPN